MKTKALLVFILLGFISCNRIEEINTFSIKKDFEDTISISELSEDINSGSWSKTIDFDVSSTPEVQANIDRFKDIRLNKFSFEIINFVGSETALMTDASLAFGDTTIPIENNINLKNADDNDTIFTIGTSSDYKAFTDILKRDLVVTIIFSGSVSEVPVSFDLKIIADTTITLEAI